MVTHKGRSMKKIAFNFKVINEIINLKLYRKNCVQGHLNDC